MIDLLLHNLRTIGTHHCDGTVGEEAADEIERLTAEVAGLREDADGWKESRDMFVARLENMALQGDKWLTIAAVMMLLYDCDMLAALEKASTTPHPSPSPRS